MSDSVMSSVKPGYKTTEFILSLALILVGAVGQVLGCVLPPDHVAFKITAIVSGTVLQIATFLGYTISRGTVKSAGMFLLVILCVLTVTTGCAALGQTPTATGATGVGSYGALSGLQAGSTQISMSGSVNVQVQPKDGMAGIPDSVKNLIAKLSMDIDRTLADPNLPEEQKRALVLGQIDLISRLAAPWSIITVTLTDTKTGEASVTGTTGSGTGGGSGSTKEPAKPEGPATPETPVKSSDQPSDTGTKSSDQPSDTGTTPEQPTPTDASKILEDAKKILEPAPTPPVEQPAPTGQ